MVTALSVWTHMAEGDAVFYLKEVHRVLRPGGRAIVTFFLLDEAYAGGVAARSGARGRYHMTPQDNWIFSDPSYGSEMWRHPAGVATPEEAIGVTEQGLEMLLSSAELSLVARYPGNWKETPGIYFQDVVVLERTP
jgi:SAM-dependent methyltransferase